MDFSKLGDGLSWFGEKASEAIWGIVYQIASDVASEAFEFVMKYVLLETDPNRLINFDSYLLMMQSISLSLLLFAVAWEGVKYQTGTFSEDVSLQTLIMRTLFAGVCIAFLPFALEHFFIKINNLFVNMIVAEGINITPGKTGVFSILLEPKELSMILVILFVVFAIAFLILGIIGGIRYVEIVILFLIAPLAAVSIVRGGELLDVWIRETIAVVFTQTIQVFLLALILNAVGKMGEENAIEIYLVTIGAIVVMISGPQAIRKFIYSTGTGSAGAKAVGGAGRMAVYKAISKGAIK